MDRQEATLRRLRSIRLRLHLWLLQYTLRRCLLNLPAHPEFRCRQYLRLASMDNGRIFHILTAALLFQLTIHLSRQKIVEPYKN